MKKGFWANYQTGIWVEIDEHELWIRRDNNAERLGIASNIHNEFERFRPRLDRDDLLLFIFRNSPAMRIRGHGATVSFEFCSDELAAPLALIGKWCSANAGPYTGIYAFNFQDNTHLQTLWKEWITSKYRWSR